MLESKFIEGTNEQYSIRNDGVVIIHYKKQRITNTRTDIIVINKPLTSRKNRVDIRINNKVVRQSIGRLLIQYFNFNYCLNCKNSFIPNRSTVCCDTCRKVNRKRSSNNYAKESVILIKDNYIATALKIPVSLLTEDLKQAYRTKISLTRKIKTINT